MVVKKNKISSTKNSNFLYSNIMVLYLKHTDQWTHKTLSEKKAYYLLTLKGILMNILAKYESNLHDAIKQTCNYSKVKKYKDSYLLYFGVNKIDHQIFSILDDFSPYIELAYTGNETYAQFLDSRRRFKDIGLNSIAELSDDQYCYLMKLYVNENLRLNKVKYWWD